MAETGLICKDCDKETIYKNGTRSDGAQKYKCSNCGSEKNPLTRKGGPPKETSKGYGGWQLRWCFYNRSYEAPTA